MSWWISRTRVFLLVGIFLLNGTGWSLAGGPISLFESGTPNLWGRGGFATFPIPYLKDQGPLGPLTNDEADALTTFSMNEWDQIPTSTFSVIDGGDTPFDITAANAASYLFSFHGAVIDVVYDHDGSICTTVFGCPPGVLGLGGPVFLGTNIPEIASALVLMNGAAIDPSDTGGAAFRVVFSQESGHAIGLHHDQTNGAISFFGDESAPNGCPTVGTPAPSDFTAMYPFADISPFGPGSEAASIDHPEDLHALSRFHPVANYQATTGTITGTVFQADGVTPVNGVNVIARNMTAPFTDARSTITGDLSTTADDAFAGTFVLTGLTPGSQYSLAIDNIVEGAFPQIPASPFTEEYWNDTAESGNASTDHPCDFSIITARAGQTFLANFILNAPDTTAPTVTINQAVGQADPTTVSPINFTVVFSEPVINFSTGDVTVGGDAGATSGVVTAMSPNDGTTYNVAVSGMTTNGTVTATLAPNVATDAAGNGNLASLSTDNTVAFSIPSPPLEVTNLSVTSNRAYRVVNDGLQNNAPTYIDRTYTFQMIPPFLAGATYIQTANNDKNSQGGHFLSFDVNQPVTVWVAHDQRIRVKPSWLTGFTLTGEKFASSDTTFDLYRRDFPAGTITLGGNHHTQSGMSMYAVAVIPRDSPPPSFSLVISLAGEGTGRVTSNVGGIYCPAFNCTEIVQEQTPIVLTAQPEAGSLFLGWNGGGCSGTDPCSLTISQNTTITATFSSPPADLDPPQVTFIRPANGQTVFGTIPVTATAMDVSGVAGIQFFLDGLPFGLEDTSEPYEISWDTTQSPPGLHTWSARARDTVGNSGDSPLLTVTVVEPSSILNITNLHVKSGRTYQVIANGLRDNIPVYIDRTYTTQNVPPSLAGATYIQTANNDKTSQGENFLSFDVNQPVTVWVAHDQRIRIKPSWLTGFTLISEQFTTTDTSFDLYRQDFPASTITLGGNEGPFQSMYLVIIRPTTLPASAGAFIQR